MANIKESIDVWIRNKGFIVGDNHGAVSFNSHWNDNKSLGVLLPNPTKTPGWRGWFELPHYPWIATIEWGNNPKHWIINIFGRENVPILEKLSIEIQEYYQVETELCLTSESTRKELLIADMF